MDAQWFKQRQKAAGVTSEQIAAKAGRDRSAVSKIYAGHQRMTMQWARAFAEVLGVPLRLVLEKAGELDEPGADEAASPRLESDVEPGLGAQLAARCRALAEKVGLRPDGLACWVVQTEALALIGFRKGDFILVEPHCIDRAQTGDVVLAKVYDRTEGEARTLLREYQAPVLVSCSPDPAARKVHLVDGSNVAITGRVVASWRDLR